jgi:hypothetical protein
MITRIILKCLTVAKSLGLQKLVLKMPSGQKAFRIAKTVLGCLASTKCSRLQKLFLNVRQLPSVQDYKNGS